MDTFYKWNEKKINAEIEILKIMKSSLSFRILSILCLLMFFDATSFAQKSIQSLAGQWQFKLDPKGEGVTASWFKTQLPDKIQLPGSCEQGGFGVKTTEPTIGKLTRVIKYEGKAWYQKKIVIPNSWKGKRIELFLERCHWESSVWLDGSPLGMQNSLSVPHLYDLGLSTAGTHILTICIDNTYKIPIGTWAHAITEDTQGNWNGIIGRMELRATNPVWIRDVQVYPNKLKIILGNITGQTIDATVQNTSCTIPDGGTEVEVPFHSNMPNWDEFSPNIQQLKVTLKTEKFREQKSVSYGIRELSINDKQFLINNRPFLMRGPVDECIYPLTGYPPMDKASWMRMLKISQSYGFNFIRFHSWCPPQAAFEAADELGMFFQVELPLWTMDAPQFGKHAVRDKFIADELERILESYGNHPSFALMAMGNESSGTLDALVSIGRKVDNRRLYRCENGNIEEKGDYIEEGGRGIAGPRTNWDRWNAIGWIAGGTENDEIKLKRNSLPVFLHEVGQWSMYPDFELATKFTGTTRAYFYDSFQASLKKHQMLDQAKSFAQASGKFSVLLYKEEIEASFRSFPIGGFQILEARDYPGQGVAIVGWLDAFWDSKGLITPTEFRHFCDSTVCLLRMPKRVFFNSDNFEALAQISHYGHATIKVKPQWSITDDESKIIAKGSLADKDINAGELVSLGNLKVALDKVQTATRLKVTLNAGIISNSWYIWVYPDKQPVTPANVRIAYNFDEATLDALKQGENVLLFSSPKQGKYEIVRSFFGPESVRLLPPVSKGKSAIEGTFLPAFWNIRLFNQIGTMGILCNPEHPALKNFPTEEHSDWQWADLIGVYTAAESFRTAGAPESYYKSMEKTWGDVRDRSKAIILNETPEDFRPIVQVIDNYERNYKLGMIFETKVGKGKLLVCSMDLDTDADKRPAARQLKSSLLRYMASKEFSPTSELSMDLLLKILTY